MGNFCPHTTEETEVRIERKLSGEVGPTSEKNKRQTLDKLWTNSGQTLDKLWTHPYKKNKKQSTFTFGRRTFDLLFCTQASSDCKDDRVVACGHALTMVH